MKLVFNKRNGAVVMSPNSEGLGAAAVAGVGSNLTQPSGISYFYLYTFSEVLASVMILGRNSSLKFVYIYMYMLSAVISTTHAKCLLFQILEQHLASWKKWNDILLLNPFMKAVNIW